jgi:hypothetical protein
MRAHGLNGEHMKELFGDGVRPIKLKRKHVRMIEEALNRDGMAVIRRNAGSDRKVSMVDISRVSLKKTGPYNFEKPEIRAKALKARQSQAIGAGG